MLWASCQNKNVEHIRLCCRVGFVFMRHLNAKINQDQRFDTSQNKWAIPTSQCVPLLKQVHNYKDNAGFDDDSPKIRRKARASDVYFWWSVSLRSGWIVEWEYLLHLPQVLPYGSQVTIVCTGKSSCVYDRQINDYVQRPSAIVVFKYQGIGWHGFLMFFR